jgi:hypothetical protein
MAYTFSNVSFIYNSNGTQITNSAALPVYVNGAVTVTGFSTTPNTNIFNSNGTSIANTTPLPVGVQSNTTNYVYTQFAPTWSLDALNKVRTSATLNQDWFVPVVDDDVSFRWNQATSGTGAGSTFIANTNEIQMTSGTSASGYAYRQTYSKFKIVPGTSHIVYTTVNWEANTSTESGVTRRTGLFDQLNGIFWEQGGVSANTLAVVIRKQNAAGVVSEDRIYANNFSVDKLDGTGPSGFNIFNSGFMKYYTFWFDFIGGRTGRLRFGMGTPIGPQICHVQSYTGAASSTTTFITDNSLPLRREVFNGASGSFTTTAPTYNMSGISFQSEAPSLFNPSPTTAYNANGFVPSTTALTPILSIGLRAGVPWTGSDITPGEFNIVDINNQGKNSTAATFLYTIVYNANINGAAIYSNTTAGVNVTTGRSSQLWAWPNTATITNGYTVLSGITQSGAVTGALDGLPGTFNLGSDMNGNPATLTLCVKQLAAGGGAANVAASWNYIEQL